MSTTKVVTAEVRFSYLNVLEPRQGENDKEPKYSVALLIDKDDTVTLGRFKTAVEEAKKQGLEKVWGGKLPAKIDVPIRDGDAERPDDPNYAGKYYVNAKTGVKYPPQVVKPVNGVFERITDPLDITSGDFGMATVNLFPYKASGNNGIGVALNAICLTRKGEPLAGGGTDVNVDFADALGTETKGSEENWMG